VSESFDQFLARVHRRAVAWGVIDRVGRTLAAAAMVSVVLVLAGAHRQMPTWPIIGAVIAFAGAVGIAWGLIRRPTRLDAAMEFDRQLNLHDLLSTALLSPADDFGGAVRAMANAACRKHSSSDVVLNKLGRRAWGGVGLAWAMVIVVSLLATQSNSSQAEQTGANSPASPRLADGSRRTMGGRNPTVGGQEATSDDHSRIDQATNDSGPAKPSNGNARKSSSTDGGGEHASQATSANAQLPTSNANYAATGLSQGDKGVGDGGTTSIDLPAGRSGQGSASGTSNHPAPPWSSDHWPADRAAALQDVQAGRVPDAYRDLVRDYFRE
jgi:hypothetical protein